MDGANGAVVLRAFKNVLRGGLVVVGACMATASACVINDEVQRTQAWRKYAELERDLGSVLRVGVAKDKVLQALKSANLEYFDFGRPDRLPDGMPPEVIVVVRRWHGIPFPEELYLGLEFRNGALSSWGPFSQAGP